MSTQITTEKTTKRKIAVPNDQQETIDLSEFTQKNYDLPEELTEADKRLIEAGERFLAALDKEQQRGNL